MAASNNNVDFRLSPNKDRNRPLSTYDNLTTIIPINLTNGKEKSASSSKQSPLSSTSPEPCQNVNEFPFNDISFQFSELQNSNHTNPTSSKNNHCNGDLVYKYNRNGGSHQMANSQEKMNENHSLASNHGAAIATKTPTTASALTNAQENNYLKNHEYENVTADTVTKRQHIFVKPVHSDAKSQFLGLNSSTAPASTSNHKIHEANVHSSDTASHFFASNRNGEMDEMVPTENEPLISNSSSSNNQFNVMPSGSGITSTSHYQNVPSNSASYLGRTKNVDSSDCSTVRDEKQNKSDKYVNEYENGDDDDDDDDGEEDLDDRITSALCASHNPNSFTDDSATMTNMGVSMQSSPSMRSVKPVTLDNSSSYRTQAVYLSTTVPQNIKGTNIMGSHTPTRNSLRHSRMVGMNKGYQIPRRRNSLNIKHPTLARVLLAFHILVGLGVSCLGLWLCWWAPSTRARENPYWSGLILMLSGILGLIVIGFKRIPRHKLRQHLFTFFRISSTFVTIIAAGCTLSAATFATLHLLKVLAPTTECNPANMFASSSACICKFGVKNSTKHEQLEEEFKENFQQVVEFYYRDLSCDEVFGPFKYILISSSVLNSIGFLICTTLLILLCMRREAQRFIYTHSSRSRV